MSITKKAGFRAGTVQTISRGLLASLQKSKNTFSNLATRNVKSTFYFFNRPVIDTGATLKNTGAEAIKTKDGLIIRFKTEDPKDYSVFPLLGLSTSTKYGVRNWLVQGANITLAELKR